MQPVRFDAEAVLSSRGPTVAALAVDAGLKIAIMLGLVVGLARDVPASIAT